VDDVVVAAVRLERLGKHGDRAHDPHPDRFLVACLEGHRTDANVGCDWPEEGAVAIPAQRPYVHFDA
jgi:hypothetical protein